MGRPLFLNLTLKEGYGSRSVSVKSDRVIVMEATRNGYTALWLDGTKDPLYVCESLSAINMQAEGNG